MAPSGEKPVSRTRGRAQTDHMDQPAEQLNRDGVALRRWRADDADEVLRAITESREHLAPWMPWATEDYDRDSAVQYLRRCESDWRSGKAFNYAILSETGGIIGCCCLMARIGPGGLEIGYWLHRAHTGRGIATRATAALTDEAFRIGARRVEIVHDTANVRSRAVPERLGFTEVECRTSEEPANSTRDGAEVVWCRVAGA